MSSKISGVQAKVKELYHLAIYTYCYSYAINLVISSASELSIISNALSTIGEVCTFLSHYVHRFQALQGKIEKEIPDASHQRLKLFYPIQ